MGPFCCLYPSCAAHALPAFVPCANRSAPSALRPRCVVLMCVLPWQGRPSAGLRGWHATGSAPGLRARYDFVWEGSLAILRVSLHFLGFLEISPFWQLLRSPFSSIAECSSFQSKVLALPPSSVCRAGDRLVLGLLCGVGRPGGTEERPRPTAGPRQVQPMTGAVSLCLCTQIAKPQDRHSMLRL